MPLYLVRHAHALDAETDALRPLSPRGHEQVRTLAAFFGRTHAFAPEEIWHSPLLRARETAQLFARELRLAAPLVEMPDLRSEDDPLAIAGRIKIVQRPVAIVGHEPHLSALATLLITGTTEAPRFTMKKCAVLALDPAGDGWAVRWHVSPELFG